MIKKVVLVQGVLFLSIMGFLFLPLPLAEKRGSFFLMAILSFVLMVLGFYLLYFVKKEKIHNPLRKRLMLIGVSSSGFLISVVLHNFLYALGVLTTNIFFLHYLFEFLHAAFFIIGTILCPIGFIIGVVSSVKLLIHTQD